MALGVALQYALQAPMRRAVEGIDAGGVGALDFLVTTVHTWSGATIGLLLAWRLAVRRARAREKVRDGASGAVPADRRGAVPPGTGARLRWIVAATNHALLYLVTGAMVGSGALHWYAGVEAAARWHAILKWALAGLAAVHVAAALWHALVRRDDIVPAMTGRGGPAARLDGS